MQTSEKKLTQFLNKFSYWLQYNKLLLVFILIGSGVISLSLKGLTDGEVRPAMQEIIVYHDLTSESGLGLVKRGQTLVAQLDQTVVRMGFKTTEKGVGTFPRAFDHGRFDLGDQSVATRLKTLYQTELTKLATFQRAQLARSAHKPAFGVSLYPEVQKMRINGQPVPSIKTFVDQDNQTWYIWYYPHLELKESDNVVEIDE